MQNFWYDKSLIFRVKLSRILNQSNILILGVKTSWGILELLFTILAIRNFQNRTFDDGRGRSATVGHRNERSEDVRNIRKRSEDVRNCSGSFGIVRKTFVNIRNRYKYVRKRTETFGIVWRYVLKKNRFLIFISRGFSKFLYFLKKNTKNHPLPPGIGSKINL